MRKLEVSISHNRRFFEVMLDNRLLLSKVTYTDSSTIIFDEESEDELLYHLELADFPSDEYEITDFE